MVFLNMIYKRIFFFLILILISVHVFAKERLIFAMDLIRHGDRTPIHEIPKALHAWQDGLGELTAIGIKQETQLGQELRKKYVNQYHLLPITYHPATVFVRSTDKRRAIMSAESLLLGLYPVSKRGSSLEIPVYIVPNKEDKLLVARSSWNIFDMLYQHFKESKLWHEKTKNLQPKLKYWSEKTGMALNNFKQVERLGNNLFIRQIHHVPLPPGITNTDAKEIISLGEYGTINRFKFKSITYPMGHQFINTMIDYFKMVIADQTTLKYVLFSAHDSTIMSVMNTLGVPVEKIPPYASHLNFALFKEGQNYLIKINYNDSVVNIPTCKVNVCTIVNLQAINSI